MGNHQCMVRELTDKTSLVECTCGWQAVVKTEKAQDNAQRHEEAGNR